MNTAILFITLFALMVLGMPQTIAETIMAAGMAPWMFLLVVNIILLVAGNFMEPASF